MRTAPPAESFNQALIDCVRACGGSKVVGPKLWPEKLVDAAQRHLLNCLNEDRPERLSPEHVLLVLKLAHSAGHHAGMGHICQHVGYQQPAPICVLDEQAQLQRDFISAVSALKAIEDRIQKRASA